MKFVVNLNKFNDSIFILNENDRNCRIKLAFVSERLLLGFLKVVQKIVLKLLSLLGRMPQLYIIAGCNGAGKTTASYTVLPEMLGCREFVNADEIAKGLSPFNPESVAIEAGRLMLQRMDDLLSGGEDFAFETTLATRSYVKFVERAQTKGYFVTLLYFWLPTPEQAIERVATRVSEGGHHIPSDVIRRRYANGIRNLTTLYTPICDYWIIYDNSAADGIHKVAWGVKDEIKEVVDSLSYQKIISYERD